MVRRALRFVCIVVAFAGCATDDSESCGMTVEAYCDGMTTNCPATLAAAENAASWRCDPGDSAIVELAACDGGVTRASVAYIDAGRDLYYDASGKLFRVEEFVNIKHRCVAGGGDTIACNDPKPRTLCSPGL
jgi:hypothetical protein